VSNSRSSPSNTKRWEHAFAALSKFREREGHCRPSKDHIEGKFKLGQWVSTQRYYKDNLSAKRKGRLNALGFVWNWRDYLWDRGFIALLKFKRREGHCYVPALHKEGNYELGYWVSTQRRYKKVYEKEISAARKARLNKVGFVWKAPRGNPHHRATKLRRLTVPNPPQPRASPLAHLGS
jgi:Helicase associated domain